jgi:hypothetical protein
VKAGKNPETTVVRKSITSAFVLDKPKLARILDIMEQRFTDAKTPFNPTFEILLSRGKRISTSSVDQLLALDNSVKNPIVELHISAGEETPRQLSCSLNFDRTGRNNIYLMVEAEDSKRASQGFAELEEQVERTLSSNWLQRFKLGNIGSGILAGMMVSSVVAGVISLAVSNEPSPQSSGYMLTKDDIAYFNNKAKEISNANDKIEFLFELQSRQLERSISKQNKTIEFRPLTKLITLRNFFLVLPLLVIIGCMVYLRNRCYPWAVFLWGDYEQFYNRLLSIRRTVWTVVIGSLLIGILGNLFAWAASTHM